MTTWVNLLATTQTDLTDSGGVFHSDGPVRSYLEQAELLLTLRRSLYERTQILQLNQQSPLYEIVSIFPDFIRPLRVFVNGLPLRWTSLAAVGRLDETWFSRIGEAESVFMVGATILGFAPLPNTTTASITYLALPPTTASIPAAGASPVVGAEWHTMMQKYAQTIALAKEGEYQRAPVALKEFLDLANIERDPEFLEGLSQRTATTNRTTERKAND